jgi:hypothetical protein
MPAQNTSTIQKILPVAMFVLAGMRLAAHLHWPPIVTAVILAIATITTLAVAHLLKSKIPSGAGSVVARLFKPVSVIWLGLIVLVLTFFGGLVLYNITNIRHFEITEQTWPATNATIVSSSVVSTFNKSGNMTWAPSWTYSYTIDGRSYSANNGSIAGAYDTHWYSRKELAEQATSSRPDGSTVVTYYDPGNPQKSVLDRRTPDGSKGILAGIASAVFGLDGLIIFALFLAWRKSKTSIGAKSVTA